MQEKEQDVWLEDGLQKSGLRALGLLLLFSAMISIIGQSVSAHVTSEDTYVRVVSADPSSRTYTFRCLPDPERGYVKDWFIYADHASQNEAQFLDSSAGQDITYTFQGDEYYHVGCIIVDPQNGSHLWRGDLHIDLRKQLADSEVVPVDIETASATVECAHVPNPFSVQWFVSTYWGAPSSPTQRISLNTSSKTVTYSPPGHGLYHPRCDITDSVTGQKVQAGIPIEFFDGKPAYIADRWGIDLNNNFRPFDINQWRSMFNGTAGTPPPNPPPSNDTGSGTYTSMRNMPAVCNMGVITSDTYDGGRHISCTDGENSLSVDVWNKPGNYQPQYFEMYRRSQAGSGTRICLGTTCIGSNGYAKSPNFPITIGNSTSGNSTALTGNISITTTPGSASVSLNSTVFGSTSAGAGGSLNITGIAAGSYNLSVAGSGYITNQSIISVTAGTTLVLNVVLQQVPPSGGTVYASVRDMIPSCTGGSITLDTWSGGRNVVCVSGSNNLSVTAWNKPGNSAPQYFEMYKKSQAGSGIRICFGTTCIGSNGYAKSPNFPITV